MNFQNELNKEILDHDDLVRQITELERLRLQKFGKIQYLNELIKKQAEEESRKMGEEVKKQQGNTKRKSHK